VLAIAVTANRRRYFITEFVKHLKKRALKPVGITNSREVRITDFVEDMRLWEEEKEAARVRLDGYLELEQHHIDAISRESGLPAQTSTTCNSTD